MVYSGFPPTHWKRLHTNNLQEHSNRKIKRKSHVVRVFPSITSLEKLARAVAYDMNDA